MFSWLIVIPVQVELKCFSEIWKLEVVRRKEGMRRGSRDSARNGRDGLAKQKGEIKSFHDSSPNDLLGKSEAHLQWKQKIKYNCAILLYLVNERQERNKIWYDRIYISKIIAFTREKKWTVFETFPFNPFDTSTKPPLAKFLGRTFFSNNKPEILDQRVPDRNFWRFDKLWLKSSTRQKVETKSHFLTRTPPSYEKKKWDFSSEFKFSDFHFSRLNMKTNKKVSFYKINVFFMSMISRSNMPKKKPKNPRKEKQRSYCSNLQQ